MRRRVVAFGEDAWLIELGDTIDETVNASVLALASAVEALRPLHRGLGRPVPAYASLLVPFDAQGTDADGLRAALEAIAVRVPAVPSAGDARLVEVAVHYGAEDGPDLEEVADRVGMSTDAVVAIHAGTIYRVFMLGFSPGFAYLGPLPSRLRLPRRAEPRLRVPAGSVAIAAGQTAVYPHATAGGWHLIGRTALSFWDPGASDPSLLRPGDRVRFVPA